MLIKLWKLNILFCAALIGLNLSASDWLEVGKNIWLICLYLYIIALLKERERNNKPTL